MVLHEHRLDALLAEAEAKVRISPPSESAAVRTMYKKVGLDPTKTRPSNEALLRRVRKGDAIPRINSAVDVVNWCSLEFQLPYGLYDSSKVSGPVTMRLGAEREKYSGIRKDDVNVAGRITEWRASPGIDPERRAQIRDLSAALLFPVRDELAHRLGEAFLIGDARAQAVGDGRDGIIGNEVRAELHERPVGMENAHVRVGDDDRVLAPLEDGRQDRRGKGCQPFGG